MLTVRPKVDDLVFQLYARSLHPELFEIVETRVVDRRPHYKATIHLTTSGHVVSWQTKQLCLTEVTASHQTPLVQKRRLMSYKLRGQRNDNVPCKGQIHYQMSFQLEEMEPEIFWAFQQELRVDGQRRGILHTFPSEDRLGLEAVSYVHVETHSRHMLVQAFHTYPNDYAVVKTQSLFDLSSS
ncbi:DUF2617 domain-containing protein [Planctomycetales bacterium 10988]|nr:DUF2617 domain-containing protein [Planctomycetales bacterium 10988]